MDVCWIDHFDAFEWCCSCHVYFFGMKFFECLGRLQCRLILFHFTNTSTLSGLVFGSYYCSFINIIKDNILLSSVGWSWKTQRLLQLYSTHWVYYHLEWSSKVGMSHVPHMALDETMDQHPPWHEKDTNEEKWNCWQARPMHFRRC